MRTKKNAAILLSTAGVIAGSVIFPTSASAGLTECEPGTQTTTFNQAAVTNSETVVGAIVVRNDSPAAAPVGATVERTDSLGATVTGSVSFESIAAPLQAEISASATASQTWSAGAVIGPVQLEPGQSLTATYGFNQVSFSGSQRSCQLDGMFGPEEYFSGTAPTSTYAYFS